MTAGPTQTSAPPRPATRSLPRERMSVGSIRRKPEKLRPKRLISLKTSLISPVLTDRGLNFRLQPGREFGLWSTWSPLFKCSNIKSIPGFSWRGIRETSSRDYSRSVFSGFAPLHQDIWSDFTLSSSLSNFVFSFETLHSSSVIPSIWFNAIF